MPQHPSSRRSCASAPPPAAAEPVGAAEAARLIEALGPFEQRPVVAVAVSGGPDSMALLRLSAVWAAGRGGDVVALHVDHGLRPESTAEAIGVRARLEQLGIACEILPWTPPPGIGGVQARARAARYALLEGACRRRGILHLLLAHQLEDQAETVAMRAARADGGAGLAGMPAARELDHVRLLRPLLTVPRARLIATLSRLGERWIEDPSNCDRRFERVRVRLDAAFEPGHWLAAAHAAANARGRIEDATAAALARHLRLGHLGIAMLAQAALATFDSVADAALGAALGTVGGREHGVPAAAIARLRARLTTAGGARATLGGCLFVRRGPDMLIMREPGRVAAPLGVAPGASARWDGRFVIENREEAAILVGAFGRAGRLALPRAARDGLRRQRVPAAAIETLPAILSGEGPVACPTLGWGNDAYPGVAVSAAPRRPMASARFAAANVV